MQDGELLQAIPGLAEGMAKGPVQIEHTGRFDGNGQFAHQGERDGGHAASFDFAREQSHGPRADGSGRHKQSEIDVGLSEQVADFVAGR